jgi:CDGSH-type Zn-finger protein/uncharacterized Fe-S cluster protein YjdI
VSDDIKTYRGEGIDVTWNKKLCIHVGECVRANNELFDLKRRPWCDPNVVDVDNVIDVVERCPSGALFYERADGEGEVPDDANTVVVSNNGPLYVRGELEFENIDAPLSGVTYRAALCRCGHSKNKPFCHNSHEDVGFRDRGAIGERGPGLENTGGVVRVKVRPGGPLLLRGNVELLTASGRVAWRGTNCALCRCGASKNKPFCDGSHRDVEFDEDNDERHS